jgi:hypothetical protein
VIPIPVDALLKRLLAATRNKLGEKGKAPKFRPMNFAAFQQSADAITVDDHNPRSNLHLGHCFVCCTTPFGDIVCGGGIPVHTP